VPLPFSFKSRLTNSLFLTTLILLACSCLLVSPLHAQQGRGVIAGHVTDSAGAALWRARVELQPLALSAKSDDQGQFIFVNLAPGDYNLVVSYVGFTTLTKTAMVTAGRVARVDVQMKVGSQPEEITVTAERGHGKPKPSTWSGLPTISFRCCLLM